MHARRAITFYSATGVYARVLLLHCALRMYYSYSVCIRTIAVAIVVQSDLRSGRCVTSVAAVLAYGPTSVVRTLILLIIRDLGPSGTHPPPRASPISALYRKKITCCV